MHFDTIAGPLIPRYAARVRRMKLSMSKDKLVKASYSSQRKLDGDSRAFTSGAFPYGPLERLAESGIVPLRAVVIREETK